ncbi:hypothetical protein PHMEG_00023373 [Phytophthora megakarya]|uniref:Uncharacterized protein n=1 Tax=Phytophthora megakarya TaxID=4795 RepID=A0A225VGE3_9STRA|nr:hypothetical protein PHMEG_00023373 [Phytophthora megakarya]
MLDGQLRVAKAYQSAIDKHVRLMARKLPWLSCINAKIVPDELIFAQLDAEKEYQYAAIDEILEVSGIARVKHELLSRLCFQQGSFHHTEVRVLPFSVADVTRAIQNCLAQRKSTEQHRCRKLIRFYNHFKAVTVDKVQVPGACPVEVTARLLQWCVVQPERTVVTWSGFFEYDGSRYVRLFEKIWVSIEPIRLKQNSTFSGQYGSILRIVVHLTPVESEFELDDIEEMSEVVIASYHRNSEMIYQALLAQLAP